MDLDKARLGLGHAFSRNRMQLDPNRQDIGSSRMWCLRMWRLILIVIRFDNHSLINTSLIIRPSILFSNATSSNTTFLNSEGQAHHQLHRPPGRPRQEHQHLRHALSGPWKLSGRFRYVSVIHVSVTLPSTFPLRFRWAGVCPTETLQKLSRNSPNVSGALQGHARARVVRVALPRDDQDLHGQHRLREGASPAQGRRGGD